MRLRAEAGCFWKSEPRRACYLSNLWKVLWELNPSNTLLQNWWYMGNSKAKKGTPNPWVFPFNFDQAGRILPHLWVSEGALDGRTPFPEGVGEARQKAGETSWKIQPLDSHQRKPVKPAVRYSQRVPCSMSPNRSCAEGPPCTIAQRGLWRHVPKCRDFETTFYFHLIPLSNGWLSKTEPMSVSFARMPGYILASFGFYDPTILYYPLLSESWSRLSVWSCLHSLQENSAPCHLKCCVSWGLHVHCNEAGSQIAWEISHQKGFSLKRWLSRLITRLLDRASTIHRVNFHPHSETTRASQEYSPTRF